MTTLAACRVGNTYALAADRRISFGCEFAALATPKIRMAAPWLALGAVGGSDGAAWVRGLTIEATPTTQAEAQAQLDAIAETYRAWAKERGIDSGALLGITPWGIVTLHTCGSADFLATQAWGIGSGSSYAIGAMHIMLYHGSEHRPAQHVAAGAIGVAAHYDTGTGHAVDVLTIEAAP